MAVTPLLICFITGILSIFFINNQKIQRALSLLGSATLLVVSIYMAYLAIAKDQMWLMQMGKWQAPFGITFYVDLFSVLMIFISAFLAFGVNVYSIGATGELQKKWGFHPLFHFMMVGVIGSFCTSDLFNLYVWFEVLLLGSFGLMALSEGKAALHGSIKYVVLNLFGSAFFLSGLGLLYSTAGTLNFADLIAWGQQTSNTGMIQVVGVMLLVAFLMKAGAFPLALLGR